MSHVTVGKSQQTTANADNAGSAEGKTDKGIDRIDLGLVFVVFIWGFSPTLFKFALSELQPLTFVFLRFTLLSLVAVAVLTVRGLRGGRAWRIRRRDIPYLILSGLSGYGIYQLFYIEGLAHTTVFASALMAATAPLWSALILAALRIERVAPLQWLGSVVSLGGVAWFLLAAANQAPEVTLGQRLTPGDMALGGALSLAAAALFAVYGIVNKRLAPHYSPPELMCYTLLIGTLALAPASIPSLFMQHWANLTWRSLAIVPYSVIFPIYLTYSIWNWAIGKRGVGYVTLFNYAVPVMAGVVGYLALREGLTPPQLAAGVVVIGGMLLARQGVVGAQRQVGATAHAADDAREALASAASAASASGTPALPDANISAPTAEDHPNIGDSSARQTTP